MQGGGSLLDMAAKTAPKKRGSTSKKAMEARKKSMKANSAPTYVIDKRTGARRPSKMKPGRTARGSVSSDPTFGGTDVGGGSKKSKKKHAKKH